MASTGLASVGDIRAFIDEYFQARSGTDEDRILSYYAEAVSLEIPGLGHERKGIATRHKFRFPRCGVAHVTLSEWHGIENEKVAPRPLFVSAQMRP